MATKILRFVFPAPFPFYHVCDWTCEACSIHVDVTVMYFQGSLVSHSSKNNVVKTFIDKICNSDPWSMEMVMAIGHAQKMQ